jgi:hypothetical protein
MPINSVSTFGKYIILFGVTFLFTPKVTNAQEYRNPHKWPFSHNSIWNTPIGSGARYIYAGIEKSTAWGMTIDEDLIVMDPGETPMEIYVNFAGWDRNKSRCEVEGNFMFAAPIPVSFIVSPSTWDGLTPNSGLAVLMPDGETIKQTQPFAHCYEDLPATSRYTFDDMNIYGEGYYGAHGGSGLSAIGGALRVGELTPVSGPVRHALKVNLYGRKNFYYDNVSKGYRWPAKRADSYASNNYGTERTSPVVEECRMGALLALPPDIDLDTLGFETEPARMLAETFRDYGAYVVDDTGWDVYAIVTEWSPDGRFADEFKKNWGFDIRQSSKSSPWARDMDRIFLNLHVVNNNSADSIGGGGEGRMPPAPGFLPKVNVTLETDGTPDVTFSRPVNFMMSAGTTTKLIVTSVPENFLFNNWEVLEGDADLEDPANPETTLSVHDADSRIRANFVSSLGLENLDTREMESFSLKFNPVNQVVSIELENINQEYSVCFYDILGKRVTTEWKATMREIKIPVHNLSYGIYIVKVSSHGKFFTTRKFLKI